MSGGSESLGSEETRFGWKWSYWQVGPQLVTTTHKGRHWGNRCSSASWGPRIPSAWRGCHDLQHVQWIEEQGCSSCSYRWRKQGLEGKKGLSKWAFQFPAGSSLSSWTFCLPNHPWSKEENPCLAQKAVCTLSLGTWHTWPCMWPLPTTAFPAPASHSPLMHPSEASPP